MTREPVVAQILHLVWPALAYQGLFLTIQLFDQFLAGRFSQSHQAALTTANYLYWFVTSYTVVVNAGATALVGRFVGGDDLAHARRATGQAILLAIAFGALAAVAGLVGLPALISTLNLEGEGAAHAVAYLNPLAVLLPCYMIEVGGIACLVGAGDTRTGLKVLATVVFINVPLAWGFSHGTGPFPDLGFVGIAWGTGLSHAVGCAYVLVVLARGRFGLKLTPADLVPDSDLIYRLLRVSVPAAIDSVSMGSFQLVFLGMINALGETAASAHGIALRLEALGYLSGAAFATAAVSFVGRALGAGRPDLAARGGWTALALGGSMMTVMGVIFFFAARPMFKSFSPENDPTPVIEAGVPVLRLIAFAMPALASTIVLTQALRGAGDTRVPVLFTWVGFLGVRLPLAYILTRPDVGMGLFGAWLAMFVDIHVRGAFFLWRYIGGKWQQIKV
ncbi:MATE family efflux transporter [Fimbriiglobus ruber]|uniref:MATE family efflux transporter n=1 Tax=Fimbriiglobus ruber TaxID=1908690 RepID=UPI001EE71EA6|nr:MATE family efflux transporter [Fimbriiglobus ruber]